MVKAVHCRGRIAGLRKHRSSGKCWRKREGAPASHSNRSLDSPQRPGRFPASGGSEPAGERPSFRVTGRVTRAAGPSQPARRPRRRKARLEHAAAARWTRDRRRRCRTESPRRPGYYVTVRRWARGYHDSGCHSGRPGSRFCAITCGRGTGGGGGLRVRFSAAGLRDRQ